MNQNQFVDTHCHLFNIVDIPLYATLQGKIEMGTLKRLLAAFALGGVLIAGKGDDLLEDNEEFIRFFERDIEDNIKWLSTQIRNTVPDKDILITPLVMDFDPIHMTTDSALREPTMEDQLFRLIEAIHKTKDESHGVCICPFLGLDLRKLETGGDSGLNRIKKLWEKYGLASNLKKTLPFETGSVIGIKLYPPIGFSPNPKDQKKKEQYLKFYRWCCEKDIPITAHCQSASGSYSVGKKSREVNKMTHGKNWWYLLEDHPEISDLRINFAHFGGEDGLEDLIDWYGTDKDSWTYYLVRLLKKYPNTYADISAYDFSDEEAFKNLIKLMEKDKDGKFEEEGVYMLEDKLLWGSDVPMVISTNAYRQNGSKNGKSEYKHLYKKFLSTGISKNKLTGINPQRFLTGG